MMLDVNNEKLAILLRYNVAAARAMMDHGDPSPYPPVDLSDFPKHKMDLYLAAIRDLKKNVDGNTMPAEMWFNTHWALFPFTSNWHELHTDAQVFIGNVMGMCRIMDICAKNEAV
jgi:hypothetical protein